MKRFKRYFSLFLIAFAVIFFLWNLSTPFFSPKDYRRPILSRLDTKAAPERSFVVVIYGKNDETFLKKNFHSVFEQKYPHFRVIYIDDGSTDGSKEKVQKWITSHHVQEKTTQIIHDQPRGKLESYYQAIHQCHDEEILLFISANGWLAHDCVLEMLNYFYRDSSVWMTYGSFLEYPSYRNKKGNRPISEKIHSHREYRQHIPKHFYLPYLRSGYAGLFKKIQLKDLLEQKAFFSDFCDHALMIPALEMAEKHAHFFHDIVYIHPEKLEKIDFRKLQQEKKHLSTLTKYSPVSYWHTPIPEVDIVVRVTQDQPLFLLSTLESLQKFTSGYRKIWVLIPESEKWKQILSHLQLTFPEYHFVQEEKQVKISSADYFFVINDHLFLSEALDIMKYAKACHEIGGSYVNIEDQIEGSIFDYSPEIAVGINTQSFRNVFITSKEGYFNQEEMKDPSAQITLYAKRKKTSPFPQHLNAEKLAGKYEQGLKMNFSVLLQNDEIALQDETLLFVKNEKDEFLE